MITLCTPTRESVLLEFVYSLVNLVKVTPDVVFTATKGTYLNNMRSMLVKTSIDNGASHILFIDSDMSFPPDTAKRLLAHNLDIVGANCKQRVVDQTTVRKGDKFISSKDKTGLEEVDTLGFGVTLIKTNVFKKLPLPWFDMPWDEKEEKHVGEDVYFCTTARRLGYRIWVDHDLSQDIGHLGLQEFRIK